MNIKKWIRDNTNTLEGKTIAITGSTGGLGKQVCEMLVSLNASLIFLNRNSSKSKQLKDHLLALNSEVSIDIINVDFENFESVKNATIELKKYNVDILVINAGAYKIERRKSDLGYDNVFQINFVSPYYLIKEMVKEFNLKQKGKVVAVSSIAHNYSKFRKNDIDFSKEKKQSKVYGNSKRFLTFSLFELFKNENDIKLSIVHPGITLTNITSHFPSIIYYLIKCPMKVIFISNKKASLSIINGIFNDCDYKCWIGPRIFNVWGIPKIKKLQTCSEVESEMIYKISEEIYKKIS